MYNLESLDEAVLHAMAAEDLFDVMATSEFSQTIVGQFLSFSFSKFDESLSMPFRMEGHTVHYCRNPYHFINSPLSIFNESSLLFVPRPVLISIHLCSSVPIYSSIFVSSINFLSAMAVQRYCADRLRLFDLALEDPDDHINKTAAVAFGRSTALGQVDRRLEVLVERMMDDARTRDGSGEIEAIGVALESFRLDKVRLVIQK